MAGNVKKLIFDTEAGGRMVMENMTPCLAIELLLPSIKEKEEIQKLLDLLNEAIDK